MNNNNYGFVFNKIYILDNQFVKKSKNSFGKFKINNEINFYSYILNNNIKFNTPKLIQQNDGEIILEYIEKSTTLTDKINRCNFLFFVNKIKEHLNILHSVTLSIPLTTIERDLQFELKKKILDRFSEFNWSSNNLFNSIKTVNGIKIQNIYYYCELIQSKLENYLNNRSYYNLIHGDTHLGNILIDAHEQIYFIDPRGYFGETKLFGIYEYDYAKLMFGLSGYSFFDNMEIDELNIQNGNIEINFIKEYEYIFQEKIFDEITVLLCLSIWLANNSCFLNINKKITSLMIAYYYSEKYIN